MGTVCRIARGAGDVTLGQAADAYLATLRGAEQASTRRVYGRILGRLVAEFGRAADPGAITSERLAVWFGGQWGDRARQRGMSPSMPSGRLPLTGCSRAGSPPTRRMLVRRKPRPDRARALSRSEVEQLLTREGVSLRERTLWRMLYETAARSAEVLALNVEDLDLPNRRARVRRKGGAIDIIVRQTGTARPCQEVPSS